MDKRQIGFDRDLRSDTIFLRKFREMKFFFVLLSFLIHVNSMKVENIHDPFFKETLTDRENAVEFFTQRLPQSILKQIDLNTLELSKDSFIDSNHRNAYSDLLFRVNFRGEPGFIYLLLEHKSYLDKFTPLQLLKYMVGIWELFIKQMKDREIKNIKLPMILPMVLYHNVENWKYKNSLSDIQSTVPGNYWSSTTDTEQTGKTNITIDTERSLIDSNHETLSIEKQCDLLSLPRSSYKPAEETPENLKIMNLIDYQHTVETVLYND